MRGPITAAARLLLPLALSLAVGCSEVPDDESSVSRTVPESAELARLHAERDYFTLRERLGEPAADEPAGIRLLRAAAAHAFNDLERSDSLLAPLLAAGAPVGDSLRYEARRIHARNLLRRHRYAEAGEVFARLASEAPGRVDSVELEDFRQARALGRVLADVPPQRVVERSASTLRRVGRGEVEVTIGDSARRHGIDTGANLSLMVRSEAEALGLDVRPAGIEIGTATDLRVEADVAVAERVRIGGHELRHVVYLVVPDEMFTFPGHGLVLRGLVGFPVAEALGELRYRGRDSIEVPAEPPNRRLRNLALHDYSPYVRVGYGDDWLVCLLDTGNGETHFYEPFYRRYRARIEAEGVRDTMRMGGAGGTRDLPSYRIDDVRLRVGDRAVPLPTAHVLTEPLTRSEAEAVLDCNLGRDVLGSRGGYTVNFRSMSVLLR